MRPRTDRQTDRQTRVTNIHVTSSTTHAKCNNKHTDECATRTSIEVSVYRQQCRYKAALLIVTDQEDEVENDEECADAGGLTGGTTDAIEPQPVTKRVGRRRATGAAAAAAEDGSCAVQQLPTRRLDAVMTSLRIVMIVMMTLAGFGRRISTRASQSSKVTRQPIDFHL